MMAPQSITVQSEKEYADLFDQAYKKLHPNQQIAGPRPMPVQQQVVGPETLMQQAQSEFPILKNVNPLFKYNPSGGQGFLEFWPGKEIGSTEHPRPKEFPLGQIGVEVYDPKTRPIDIMGDIASHHLVETDPRMKGYYKQFQESLTPDQRGDLQRQYKHAQENFGEKRPYAQWEQASGLPGYFRGYPFQQWEDSDIYTPDQITMFQEMMSYLRGGK